MAYVATITKVGVNKKKTDIYSITLNLTIINDEDSSEVLNKNYTKDYNVNVGSLDNFRASFLSSMQEDWDKIIDELTQFENTALDSLVSSMQTTANTYINS